MELVRPFNKLNKDDAALAGGKGASLGEMTQAGIPVPPGFVILADAFEKFIEETDLDVEIDAILHTVNHQEIHTVENASEKIQALILAADMPQDIAVDVQRLFKELNTKYVAVRSSATAEDSSAAAWAGQLDSFLNTTEKDLLEKVKRCWASLFTPRAIFYRFEKELHKTKISVAVVVQKMVESEVSGIAFSVHPVTQDYNQLIIEAGFGLGEAIVSGQVTPDSYVVEKNPRNILDINISTQERGIYRVEGGGNEWRNIPEPQASSQVLTKEQILELSEIIIGIEKHYGFPCDIEWAFEKGKFYIVQSRPITTLIQQVNGKEGQSTNSPKLILEKTITRDWPLFIAEMLHRGFIDEFKKQFDFGYTEVLFHFYDKQLDVYRAPKEHVDGLREFVLQNLAIDPKFLTKISSEVKKQYDALIEKIEYIKAKDLSSFDNKGLFKLIEEFIGFHSEIEPRFVINFWFPIQMEKHQDNNKWKEEIAISAKTRAETEKVGPEGDLAARKLCEEVGRRMGIKKELSKYISLLESRKFLLDGRTVDASELIKRERDGFTFGSLGILYVNPDDYAQREGYEVARAIIKSEKELKGTVAYGGTVKGTVRVIKSKANIDRLNEGEILVTAMTTPEFVPAMKKAIAFITDEGGITCHAAIVAREMRKPCIIGTKIATEILKDGDLVEVDAEKGVVRIIENKEFVNKNEIEVRKTDSNPVEKFINLIGSQTIMSFDAAFFPFTVFFDWLRYIDSEGVSHELKPLLFYRMPSGMSRGYLNDSQYCKAAEEGLKSYLKNPAHIDEVQTEYDKLVGEIGREYEIYFGSHPEISEKQSFSLVKRLHQLLVELVKLTLPIERLDKKIIKAIIGDSVDLEKIWKVSELTTFESFEARNAKYILSVLNHKKDTDLLRYIYSGYTSLPTREDIQGEISKIDKDLLEKHIRDSESNVLTNKKKRKIELEKLNTKEKYILKYIDWVMEMRDHRKAFISQSEIQMAELGRKLFEYWGLDPKLVNHMSILELVRGRDFVSSIISKLQDRLGSYAIIYTGDEADLEQTSEDVSASIARLDEMIIKQHADGEVRELVGEIGSRGFAVGKAKIILATSEFGKFAKGDILVAPMTRPEYVPLMKQAKAIITDEGGITCHAAIVSRELGIPCIIGTKIATKVLKDGDMVEVDAEKGVIKILK